MNIETISNDLEFHFDRHVNDFLARKDVKILDIRFRTAPATREDGRSFTLYIAHIIYNKLENYEEGSRLQ